jgi:hypothetical protein
VTCTDYKQGWASSIVEIRCPSVAQPLCATLRANSALRPTSSSFRVLGGIDHHHNQHNKTTTLNVHLNITATLLESDKNIAHNCLAGFDIPLRTHCDRKGHRLFAPGAFPPRVNKTALFELLQPRTTTRPSARYLLSSVTPTHCRRRAPRSRRSVPARQTHNNGLNTASNVAPRAYTSRAYARTTTRQLRAVLSPPFETQHCAKQSLRLNSRRPPSQGSPSTRNHPATHRQESTLRQHTHISTFITSFASPTPSPAQDASQDTCQSRIGRRAQRLGRHFTPPPPHPTFYAAHTKQDTQETQRRIHEQHRPCPQFPALLAKRRHAFATQDEEVKSQVLSWLRPLRGRLERQPGANSNLHRHQRSCSGARRI